MQDEYSLAKCEQYGRRLATRLCQQYFGFQPAAALDGPALLQFTPVRQLNLLVLRQLLGHWQQETQQLRSAYFDFEAEAVRAALTQFMNVLSRHIRLDRAALEPLLAQAAADTLLLAANPVLAFERLLLPAATPDADEPIALAQLRAGLRYIDQDKEYYQNFIDSLPTSNAPLGRDFLVQHFAIYQAKTPKSTEAMPRLVAAFSALLPLTEADLWGDGPIKPATPVSTPPKPDLVAPARTSIGSEGNLMPPTFTSIASQGDLTVPTSTSIASEGSLMSPTSTSIASQGDSMPPTSTSMASQGSLIPSASTSIASKPDLTVPARASTASEPVALPAVPTGPVPLYEKLKGTQPSTPHLAETLRHSAQGSTTPLAERGAPKVASLRDAISINQRFSFINELFNGENMEYHAAIQHLDALPTADAALAYVRQELADRHDWSRKEEHVGKLLKLIERKFAA